MTAPTHPYPQRVTDEELERRFRYHRPTAEAARRHEIITEATLALAKTIRDVTPFSREQSLALTELESVRMRANAAIACNHDLLVTEKL